MMLVWSLPYITILLLSLSYSISPNDCPIGILDPSWELFRGPPNNKDLFKWRIFTHRLWGLPSGKHLQFANWNIPTLSKINQLVINGTFSLANCNKFPEGTFGGGLTPMIPCSLLSEQLSVRLSHLCSYGCPTVKARNASYNRVFLWDYTFYKWGSNWLITDISGRNCSLLDQSFHKLAFDGPFFWWYNRHSRWVKLPFGNQTWLAGTSKMEIIAAGWAPQDS